jgi:hypothetical protein
VRVLCHAQVASCPTFSPLSVMGNARHPEKGCVESGCYCGFFLPQGHSLFRLQVRFCPSCQPFLSLLYSSSAFALAWGPRVGGKTMVRESCYQRSVSLSTVHLGCAAREALLRSLYLRLLVEKRRGKSLCPLLSSPAPLALAPGSWFILWLGV